MEPKKKFILQLILILLLKGLDLAFGQADELFKNDVNRDKHTVSSRSPNLGCKIPSKPNNGTFRALGDHVRTGDNFVKSSTILIYTCDPGYYLHSNSTYRFKGVAVCNDDGNWNQKIECRLCGVEPANARKLAINATNAKRGGSPWHVAIFNETHHHRIKYCCGGTIVTAKLVITAAHCFDPVYPNKNYSKYSIAAGKLYSAWNHEADKEYVQKHQIYKVSIPVDYTEDDKNMQADIAFVVIKELFLFSDVIYPVCLDVNVIKPGIIGKVFGWGLTEEGNTNSLAGQLQMSLLPVIDKKTCKAESPGHFVSYVSTNDKFCVGYTNNSGPTLCDGDSGSGFLTETKVDDIVIWYLRGVVSVAPANELLNTCKQNSYTLMTAISYHTEQIEKFISEYE